MEPTQHPSDPKEKQGVKPYLKYSGLAFQMIVVMSVAAIGGRKLDAYFQNDTPWWTLGLLVVAVFATMYSVIVSLTRKN
jgi:hypothetical protein